MKKREIWISIAIIAVAVWPLLCEDTNKSKTSLVVGGRLCLLRAGSRHTRAAKQSHPCTHLHKRPLAVRAPSALVLCSASPHELPAVSLESTLPVQ